MLKKWFFTNRFGIYIYESELRKIIIYGAPLFLQTKRQFLATFGYFWLGGGAFTNFFLCGSAWRWWNAAFLLPTATPTRTEWAFSVFQKTLLFEKNGQIASSACGTSGRVQVNTVVNISRIQVEGSKWTLYYVGNISRSSLIRRPDCSV